MRNRQNVSKLYQQANSLKLELQNDLLELEREGNAMTDENFAEIKQRMQELTKVLSTMSQLAETSSKKILWKSRHKTLADQLWSFHQTIQQQTRFKQQTQYQRDHEALLGSGNLDAVVIQGFQEEGRLIDRSDAQLEEALDGGREIIETLRKQRENLSGIGSKLQDMFGSLGVSRSLLRLAERQNSIDRYTVYGGISFVLLLFYVTFFFDTSMPRFNLV